MFITVYEVHRNGSEGAEAFFNIKVDSIWGTRKWGEKVEGNGRKQKQKVKNGFIRERGVQIILVLKQTGKK
jgi:hypothetical protein